ncbi:MAG: alpha/beta fold hydrolase [Saprospirales bacterium]|nr:alpha/beta fold hydrolase [Saprospirales bacterium]
MEFWLYLLIALVVALALGNFFTMVIQDFFIFRPERLREDYSYVFEKPYEELFIQSPDKGRLNALWFRQDQRPKTRGVILYCHGNRGSLRRWGHLHYFFARLGYDFFTYDYRGFGKSRGRRTESILYEDARAVYDFVRAHYPPEQIVIFGRSMGSAFASWLAGRVEARLLILETPFASMRRVFRAYFPFMPPVFRYKYLFPNHRWLRSVSIPVYIFQGDEDLVVPFRVAAALKPVLKPGDRFFRIEGGSHNDLLYYDKYLVEMEKILNWALTAKPVKLI